MINVTKGMILITIAGRLLTIVPRGTMQTPMYALSVYIATMIAHVKIHMHLLIMSALNALNNNTIV